MPEPDQQAAPPAAKRGEAAWKAHKERIAERNDQARKAGKQERKAIERERSERRRVMDLREATGLPGKSA
jgi:hypothetical protein